MAPSEPAPEPLSLAQVFADLSSLFNTDNPEAVKAFLRANQTLSRSRTLREKKRQTSIASGPSFGSLGKRIVEKPVLSRANSNIDSPGPPTPQLDGSPVEPDVDLKRAEDLVKLYGTRGKLKQMSDKGLVRARGRVHDVVERYQNKELEEKERVAKARNLGVEHLLG